MRTAVFVLAAAGAAGSAPAQVLSRAQAFPMDGVPRGNFERVVYDTQQGGFSAFPPRTGEIGFDDYESTALGVFEVQRMGFYGGATTPNSRVRIDFYASRDDTVPVNTYTMTLTSSGLFLWIIELGPGSGFYLPASGVVRLNMLDGRLGQWVMLGLPPQTGYSDPTYGSGALLNPPRYNGMFFIQVPAPGCAALVAGLGWWMGRRRR